MPEIKCHLLTVVPGLYRRVLRRYSVSKKCTISGYGFCDASVVIEAEVRLEPDKAGEDYSWPHDDPRWPKTCKCGYQFSESNVWQHNLDQLWQRDTGEKVCLHEAKPGDMWLADWMSGMKGSVHHKGGAHLIVMTPAGHWDVDSKSSNGDGWTRSGEPPMVVARPSIGVYGKDGKKWAYHGYLGGVPGREKPGFLVDV